MKSLQLHKRKKINDWHRKPQVQNKKISDKEQLLRFIEYHTDVASQYENHALFHQRKALGYARQLLNREGYRYTTTLDKEEWVKIKRDSNRE